VFAGKSSTTDMPARNSATTCGPIAALNRAEQRA